MQLVLHTLDINECGSNNGGCNQLCTNTAGSFTCSCRTGFTLGSNRQTCVGEFYYWRVICITNLYNSHNCQITMSVLLTMVAVIKPVPTLLDHFSAVVVMDMFWLVTKEPAMVSSTFDALYVAAW